MAAATTETTRHYTEADFIDFEHTGPGTLAGRYMRLFWQPVYVAEELKAGWAVPIKIMSQDLTLYRGETGAVHLVDFRCAHRGTQLSTGWVEDDCIRCRYHGWMYDATGQCVEAPLEAAGFPSRIRIKSYPVHEYLGLVFAYLGEGDVPALPRYPALEEEGVLSTYAYSRACNYFNNVENDPGHTPFTHRNPKLPKGVFDFEVRADALWTEETAWGIICTRDIQSTQHLMPNGRTLGDRRRPSLHWLVPIDDESYTSVHVARRGARPDAPRRREGLSVWHAAGRYPAPQLINDVLAGDLRLQDLDADYPPGVNMVRVQDGVTQIGQGIIRDRNQEHLGRGDAFVALVRKVWERELRALADGRPIKQWRPTDDMFPEPEDDPGPVLSPAGD